MIRSVKGNAGRVNGSGGRLSKIMPVSSYLFVYLIFYDTVFILYS